MNFQKIPPVERAKTLLDIAFRKAREKGTKKLQGTWLEKIKKKESIKLDVAKDTLTTRIDKIEKIYPDLRVLPEFYHKLMGLTIEIGLFKKSLASLKWTNKTLNSIHRKYIQKIHKAQNREKIKSYTKECYGRFSSIVKQIDSNLQYLEECRKIMRTYPDIKDLFTVCLYGFPNVGKSTLLNTLTNTKAKTASYAFTTLTINAGYLETEKGKIQILDVPGTLSRPEKMNNVELQAKLVLEELANLVIYVFDLTENCGYSIEKQQKLYKRLMKERHKTLIFLSKKDLLTEEDIKQFPKEHFSLEELKAEIEKLAWSNP